MVVVYSLAAALAIGAADFFGAIAGRRGRVVAVTFWMMLTSWGPIALVAIAVGGTAEVRDYVLGGIGGLGAGIGLLMLYAGYARATIGVVGPSAAVVSAVVPVSVGLFTGDPAGPVTLAGIAIGVVAIGLIGWVRRDEGGGRGAGLAYGVAAGAGFGLLAVGLGITSEASNILPVIATRFGSLVVVGAIAMTRRGRLWPVRGSWRFVLLAATGSTIGMSFYTLAAQENLVVAGMLLQMMYAVSALLAIVFFQERPARHQIAGFALAAMAVALVAI